MLLCCCFNWLISHQQQNEMTVNNSYSRLKQQQAGGIYSRYLRFHLRAFSGGVRLVCNIQKCIEIEVFESCDNAVRRPNFKCLNGFVTMCDCMCECVWLCVWPEVNQAQRYWAWGIKAQAQPKAEVYFKLPNSNPTKAQTQAQSPSPPQAQRKTKI